MDRNSRRILGRGAPKDRAPRAPAPETLASGPLPPKGERLTAKQVAYRLGVSVPAVYNYGRRGWLKTYKVGGRRYFDRRQVAEYIERGGFGEPPLPITPRPGTVRGTLSRDELYDDALD